jgi:hypothetical protein
MAEFITVSTPQFRTALIRKLKNIAPDYHTEFLERERGIGFRMTDRLGRIRSKPMTIYRNDGRALERKRLEALLQAAGFPGVFEPLESE